MKFGVKVLALSSVIAACSGGIVSRWEFSSVALPFRYHNLVPQFIDQAPKQLLEVIFPHFSANLGNVVAATPVTNQPELHWICDESAYYTVTMIDVDPMGDYDLLREASLWVVGNINDCDVNKGQVLTDWFPPSQINGTGNHRILTLLFQQPREITFEEKFITKGHSDGRLYTSIRKFALKCNLGQAVAGNFFEVSYDPRVDKTFSLAEYGPFQLYIQDAIERAAAEREQKRRKTVG